MKPPYGDAVAAAAAELGGLLQMIVVLATVVPAF